MLLDDEKTETQKANKVNKIKGRDSKRLLKQCFSHHEKQPFSLTDFKLTSKFGFPEERVSDVFDKARKLLDEPGAITNATSWDEQRQTVKRSCGPKPYLLTPSSRNRYLLTCPCKTYNMFHDASAASADIGIVMEYLMEVVKKSEQEKQKNLIIFD